MNILLSSILNTLQNTHILLVTLSNSDLSNSSIAPYYSSIGSHIRHILDFYDCILVEENIIDLTARKRNIKVETCCSSAEDYLNTILNKLKSLDEMHLERSIQVVDDLGLGKIQINYMYSSLLAQANSHTIHHYAIINYILDGLNINISDERFGYNPTTPKSEANI